MTGERHDFFFIHAASLLYYARRREEEFLNIQEIASQLLEAEKNEKIDSSVDGYL